MSGLITKLLLCISTIRRLDSGIQAGSSISISTASILSFFRDVSPHNPAVLTVYLILSELTDILSVSHVSADLYPFFKAAVLPEDMVTVLIRHVMYKDGRIHTIVIPDNRYRTRDLDFSRLRHLRRVLFLDTVPPTEEILNRLNGTSVQSVYIVEGRLYDYDDDVEFLLPYEYDGLEDLDPEGKYSFKYFQVEEL